MSARPRFTADEEALIVAMYSERREIIECEYSSICTKTKKTKAWNEILMALNSRSPHCQRNVDEIKKKWKNMKSKAKEKIGKIKKYEGGTGGGPKIDMELTGNESQILDMYKDMPNFEGITGGIDTSVPMENSDINRSAESEQNFDEEQNEPVVPESKIFDMSRISKIMPQNVLELQYTVLLKQKENLDLENEKLKLEIDILKDHPGTQKPTAAQIFWPNTSERLIEQKLPVMTVLSMNSETSKLNLREDQWELESHVIDLLRPFEIAMRKLCAGSSCISQMIPFVQILNRGLEKALVESEFLRSPRKQMIDGLESRTEKLFDNANCILATVLDPRFKLKLFDDALKIKAKVVLTQLLDRESPGYLDDVSKESSAKRSKTDDEFDALMKEIIDNSGDENPSSASAELEIQSYLDEKTNSETDPLSFWKAKRVVYPQLSKFARKYFSAPATSVPSEGLFSSTGNICSDKRSRLLPERLEMLVYLAKNLRILDFEY